MTWMSRVGYPCQPNIVPMTAGVEFFETKIVRLVPAMTHEREINAMNNDVSPLDANVLFHASKDTTTPRRHERHRGIKRASRVAVQVPFIKGNTHAARLASVRKRKPLTTSARGSRHYMKRRKWRRVSAQRLGHDRLNYVSWSRRHQPNDVTYEDFWALLHFRTSPGTQMILSRYDDFFPWTLDNMFVAVKAGKIGVQQWVFWEDASGVVQRYLDWRYNSDEVT